MLTLKSKNTGFFTSLRCLYSVKCAVNGIRLSQFLRSSAKRRKLKTRIAKKEIKIKVRRAESRGSSSI